MIIVIGMFLWSVCSAAVWHLADPDMPFFTQFIMMVFAPLMVFVALLKTIFERDEEEN